MTDTQAHHRLTFDRDELEAAVTEAVHALVETMPVIAEPAPLPGSDVTFEGRIDILTDRPVAEPLDIRPRRLRLAGRR